MTTEPGPATRRRQLGRQLRDLRLAAGLRTMEAAASRSGLSRATISRIENAKQTILPRTVRLLCQTYGIGAPLLEHLAKQAEESEDRGWLLAYSDTTPNWFERFLGEEAEAAEIWEYGAEFVPGLLQTPDYCRAVSVANDPNLATENVDRLVEFRLARQELLARDSPPRLHVVLNEAVLRRQVGGADVMRDQLRHLAEMAKRPNITVQVLPFSAGAHPAMVGSFIMLNFPAGSGDPTIFVEVDAGALYPDRPADFERYTWMFGQLRDLGLSPAESTDFVSKVKGEC
jgi:transcriptional regulator with XRE-family HTH domain